MGSVAAYDGIADWYEEEFLGARSDGDPLGIGRAVCLLLGSGSGVCLEIGCGTGVYVRQVGELGWTPVGVGPVGWNAAPCQGAVCPSPKPMRNRFRSGMAPCAP